jgi:hypothetical protein
MHGRGDRFQVRHERRTSPSADAKIRGNASLKPARVASPPVAAARRKFYAPVVSAKTPRVRKVALQLQQQLSGVETVLAAQQDALLALKVKLQPNATASGCSVDRPLIAKDAARKRNALFFNRWRRSTAITSALLNEVESLVSLRDEQVALLKNNLAERHAAILGQELQNQWLDGRIEDGESLFLRNDEAAELVVIKGQARAEKAITLLQFAASPLDDFRDDPTSDLRAEEKEAHGAALYRHGNGN